MWARHIASVTARPVHCYALALPRREAASAAGVCPHPSHPRTSPRAPSNRYADAVEMLLRAGAKPSLMDMEGKNALDYAESAEFDDVVQVGGRPQRALARGFAHAFGASSECSGRCHLPPSLPPSSPTHPPPALLRRPLQMLAACDDGPSICSTFRDGTEPSLSQRAGTGTSTEPHNSSSDAIDILAALSVAAVSRLLSCCQHQWELRAPRRSHRPPGRVAPQRSE